MSKNLRKADDCTGDSKLVIVGVVRVDVPCTSMHIIRLIVMNHVHVLGKIIDLHKVHKI